MQSSDNAVASKVGVGSSLVVEVTQHAHATIARIKGDARLRNVDELERQLRPLLASRPKVLVLDLADLTFISSLGLGILVQLHRTLAHAGCALRLAALQKDVEQTVIRCQLHTVVSLFPTLDSALEDAT